jgi:hypothetical protein
MVEALIVAGSVVVGSVLVIAVLPGAIASALAAAADKISATIASRPAAAPVSADRGAVMVRWEDEEIEFAPKDAANIISELIADVFKDLTTQDKMLLQAIYRSHNAGNLHRLPEDFRRGSQEHQYYRRLRDAHLIRPVENKFLPGARIEMTEFGLAVIQRFPSLLQSDDTGVGLPPVAAGVGA